MLSKLVSSAAIITSFVTIVNPVRGSDFWSHSDQVPLTVVKAQKEIIENSGFSATWLLRPDAIFDSEIVGYFKDFPVWGQPWGVPYYPSKNNILVPAQTTKNKLDLVVFQWAARDPVNGYGGGVEESTFSVQANDYLKHELSVDYFSSSAKLSHGGFVPGKLNLPFSPPKPVLLFYCFIVLSFFIFLFLKNKWFGILIFFGTLTQSFTMIKSGLLYPFGMGFWGPNGHDGVWHLALINQLSKFSLNHPTFAGERIANYHFGFDLLVALIHKATHLPIHTLYFQILPPIFSILLGILTANLVKKLSGSRMAAFWSTFFAYFGGSFGWIVTALRGQGLAGESIFWASQAISLLINPPFALSIILFLLGLTLLLDYLKRPTRKLLIFLALLFGGLIQIKVYGGVIVLGALGIFGVLGNFWLLRLFFASLLVSLALFLPFNWQAGSLLVFSPFWFPHTMLAFSDRLGWTRLANARQAWLAAGNYLKWLIVEVLALLIFLLGNLGTRIIGFLSFRKSGLFNFLQVMAGMALILSLFFVQKGNPWNTIQFFYYFLFILNLLAGIAFAKLIENKSLLFRNFLIAVLVLLTLPTTFSTLSNHYLPSRAPARISFEELEALEFLKKQEEGTVLTYPFKPEWRRKFSEPRPLYAYETTAYIAAFSGKQTFLADEMNLEISNYDWQPRRQKEIRFFETDEKEWARKFLLENKIRYLYLVKGQRITLGEEGLGLDKVFENGEVRIYRVCDKI